MLKREGCRLRNQVGLIVLPKDTRYLSSTRTIIILSHGPLSVSSTTPYSLHSPSMFLTYLHAPRVYLRVGACSETLVSDLSFISNRHLTVALLCGQYITTFKLLAARKCRVQPSIMCEDPDVHPSASLSISLCRFLLGDKACMFSHFKQEVQWVMYICIKFVFSVKIPL